MHLLVAVYHFSLFTKHFSVTDVLQTHMGLVGTS